MGGRKPRKLIVNKYVYFLKGKPFSAHKFWSIPNSPSFNTSQEAERFYQRSQKESFIRWDFYKEVAVFRRPVLEDEFVHNINSIKNENSH